MQYFINITVNNFFGHQEKITRTSENSKGIENVDRENYMATVANYFNCTAFQLKKL